MIDEAIYISINPTALSKIENGTKTYEFRNYKPIHAFKYLYVYETAPTSELKYVIKIGNIIEYPEKINDNGDGNLQFNNGTKSKFAYSILKVFKLSVSIPLRELRERFNFIPPQGFAYGKKYPELSQYVNEMEKINCSGGNEK